MRTAPALLTVLVASLALTGCVPDDEPVVVDPSPSATPIFESEEEALAAAEAAYGEYLAVSDLISASGGDDVEGLAEYVTSSHLETLLAEYEEFKASGRRTAGQTTFDSLQLQQYSEIDNEAVVVVYLCLDVSQVRVIDQEGLDVTSADRKLRLPLEIQLTTVDRDGVLLIENSTYWDGDDFCV